MSSCKATESFCFVHTTQYIYEEDNESALERLGRQGTFKFQALWSVGDSKRLRHVGEKRWRKPWFDKECVDFLDQRKQAKMQLIQDPSQSNVDNLNNI